MSRQRISGLAPLDGDLHAQLNAQYNYDKVIVEMMSPALCDVESPYQQSYHLIDANRVPINVPEPGWDTPGVSERTPGNNRTGLMRVMGVQRAEANNNQYKPFYGKLMDRVLKRDD